MAYMKRYKPGKEVIHVIPEGYVLVPLEPTQKTIDAFYALPGKEVAIEDCYKAILRPVSPTEKTVKILKDYIAAEYCSDEFKITEVQPGFGGVDVTVKSDSYVETYTIDFLELINFMYEKNATKD